MADLKKFISNVEQMRVAQRHHAKLISNAKKSKVPADWAAAGAAGKIAMSHESKVDSDLPQMLNITILE